MTTGRTNCASLFPAVRRVLLAAVLGLSGCGTVSKLTESVVALGAKLVGAAVPGPDVPGWKSLTVVASVDANQNSPIALDLVFVRDPALVQALSATPASKWFASRADTLRTFPEGVGVVSLEVVPGQTVRLTDPAHIRQPARVVLAFASYPSPGEHRERLLPSGDSYLLQLGPKGFKGGDAMPPAPK